MAQTFDHPGASSWGNPFATERPTGHYWVIPAGTTLPAGIALIADGVDVGGSQLPTHHTLYPTEKMAYTEFQRRIQEVIRWEYAGYKPKANK